MRLHVSIARAFKERIRPRGDQKLKEAGLPGRLAIIGDSSKCSKRLRRGRIIAKYRHDVRHDIRIINRRPA